MAAAVDAGITRGWPPIGRSIWAYSLVAGIMAAVLLLISAFGVVTAETLAEVGSGSTPTPTVAQHFTVYIGLLLVAIIAAGWLEQAAHISGDRAIAAIGGVLFLFAAIGRPWWIFASLRRLGWFALIESDVWMKRLLIIIGAALLGGAWLRTG